MNRQTLGIICLAICCVVVLGTASSAMDTAVETSPNDALPSELFSLPFGTASPVDMGELSEDIRGEETQNEPTDGDERSQAPSGTDQSEETMDRDETDQSPGSAGDNQAEEPDTDRGDPEDSGGSEPDQDQQDGDGSTQDSAQDPPSSEEDRDYLSELLALLKTIFAFVRSMFPLLIGLVVLGALLSQRRRVALLLNRVRSAGGDKHRSDGGTTRDGPVASNPIERTWIEMLTRLDLEDGPSKTPREWAAEAIDAGADPEPVHELTTIYETVRYSETPITDDRILQADQLLEQISSSDQEIDQP